jgi:hypothetical protein
MCISPASVHISSYIINIIFCTFNVKSYAENVIHYLQDILLKFCEGLHCSQGNNSRNMSCEFPRECYNLFIFMLLAKFQEPYYWRTRVMLVLLVSPSSQEMMVINHLGDSYMFPSTIDQESDICCWSSALRTASGRHS